MTDRDSAADATANDRGDGLSYAAAGVDIDAGERAVELFARTPSGPLARRWHEGEEAVAHVELGFW